MIRLWGVQLAGYNLMVADEILLSMLRQGALSIAEEPIQDDPGPYIVIGESTGVPEELLTESGGQHTLTMHIWHRDAPMEYVKRILDRLTQIFQHAQFTILDDSQLVASVVELAEAMRDEIFIHGVFRVRIVTFG